MAADAFAILMAGGSGERFWPLSRRARPKQMIPLPGGRTLLETAVERLAPVFPRDRILVVTSALYGEAIRTLKLVPDLNVVDEPVGRDTAAAIGLGAVVADARSPGAAILALPADHIIADSEAFRRSVRLALDRAQSGAIVTFGVKPREPATTWGYLQRGAKLADGVHAVAKFHEKPDRARAEAYVKSGDCFWNAGMFAATTRTMLDAIGRHLPELAAGLARLKAGLGKNDFPRLLAEVYPTLPKISIDYGVMEKAERVEMVDADFGLSDVGTWDAFAAHFPSAATSVLRESKNCFVVSDDGAHLVALDGVDDLLVVHTRDATLVCRRDRATSLKDLLKLLRDKGFSDRL